MARTRAILLSAAVATVAILLDVVLPRPPSGSDPPVGPTAAAGIYSKASPVPSQLDRDLTGKVALVTGGSSGLGRELATKLASLGCTVVITSRSLDRAEKEAESIAASSTARAGDGRGGEVIGMALNLNDFDSVRSFSDDFLRGFSRLNYLVENAGMAVIDGSLPVPSHNKEGVEHLYAANYLGHFLLTQLLLPVLIATYDETNSKPRIVAVSSIVHWVHDTKDLTALLPSNGYWSRGISTQDQSKFWTMVRQYGNTKFLQIAMCFEMQRRIPQVIATPVIPGFARTNIGWSKRDGKDKGLLPIQVSVERGIETSVFALLGDPKNGGMYVVQPYWSPLHQGDSVFRNFDVVGVWEGMFQKFSWGVRTWQPHPNAFNQTFTANLWTESVEVVQNYIDYHTPSGNVMEPSEDTLQDSRQNSGNKSNMYSGTMSNHIIS